MHNMARSCKDKFGDMANDERKGIVKDIPTVLVVSADRNVKAAKLCKIMQKVVTAKKSGD